MGCIASLQDPRVSPEAIEGGTPTAAEPSYLAEKRTCTDITFLVLMVAFVIVLIGLLGYCMLHGDIHRIINGYDDCGNVCGLANVRREDLPCSGADHRDEKFLLVNPSLNSGDSGLVYRACVQSCDTLGSYRPFLNRCLPFSDTEKSKTSFFSKTGLSNFFQEVSEDLETCWEPILYLCIFSFVISILLVIALRFIVGVIVWLVLVGIVLAAIFGTIFLWFQYKQSMDTSNEPILVERKNWYLAFAIIITIATICICLIIFALRRRIALVIQLFKEAGKAVTSMPLLLFEPILTFLSLSFFASLWMYFALDIESAGKVVVDNNRSLQYMKDSTMMVSRWYNLLAVFWFINFTIGCQHMIIAGAVALWFFTRNKSNLSSPISQSFKNLVFYHMGTVAKGSFLLALTNLIRILFKWLVQITKNPQHRYLTCCTTCCQCCLCIFEKFLQYLNRNAYIETAISGQPFCTSAKRAFTILASNALRVFAINSIGDFVLLLAKAFIVLTTVLLGMELISKKEGVYHSWVPLTVAGLFAYFIAHCFISVYEMTIDTIFICFCEDCEQNDGINKPYFMSRGLMEYVQNSKKVLQLDEEQAGGNAWSADDVKQ